MSLANRQVAGCRLDVHLRAQDQVHVYCGLTRPIVVRLKTNGELVVSAAKSYVDQPCASALFGRWRQGDVDEEEFEHRLTEYLNGVEVASRWVSKEGHVHSVWSRVTEPWIPFDREAVLGYESTKHRDRAQHFDAVERARGLLDSLRNSKGYARLPRRGGKADQLAVDPDGRLVVIEFKDASASSVYYAPLQLLQYVWEWQSAIDAVQKSVQRLLDARVRLGLTPAGLPRIGRRIRPVVGFGADLRSKEVKRRYGEVLDIVNAHLPPMALPVETWSRDPLCRLH